MAQRDTKSTSTKEQPLTRKLQGSVSQPTSSNPQRPNSRRHSTLPVPLNNTYPSSAAERYILSRSQMLINPNQQQDVPPESPLAKPPSIARTNISSVQYPMNHAELMHDWHKKEANKINKKEKHRYTYGSPPS